MNDAPGTGLRLTDRQRLNWLRLIRSQNVGAATFRDLVNRFGSAEAALDALPALAQRGGAMGRIRVTSTAEAEDELGRIHAFGARLVAIGEPAYPAMLMNMDMPPPLITVAGDPSLFERPAVAIVGARNASAAGTKMARMLASGIGARGHAIVSGLARGIDRAAHIASLETGTIAVVAGGLDKPYPPENVELFEAICQNGAVVSEMPMGWEPRARDFPRRNRLIAGLSLGLVVVEAAPRSGSLISARIAAEQGRLVFAVPGSPLDPRSTGTNGLLRDGALMARSAEDVLEEIAPMLPRSVHSLAAFEQSVSSVDMTPPDEQERHLVLDALGTAPIAMDDLIRHTGLAAAQIAVVIVELELAGRLERHSGGVVSIVPPAP